MSAKTQKLLKFKHSKKCALEKKHARAALRAYAMICTS